MFQSSLCVTGLKEGTVRQQYHVYEVPWEADRGLLWATMPITRSVFVLVIDVDDTIAERTGTCIVVIFNHYLLNMGHINKM